tara:strand:+ start:618 stop:1202 length:585 start_codon:yes stop_codon:yes gene_type:complete
VRQQSLKQNKSILYMNTSICNNIRYDKNGKTKTKKEKDKVYTPENVAIDCLEYTLPFIKEDHVLYEPFLGKGAFYNNFPITNPKIWSEIDEGRDFLLDNNKFDWIITNPPYSIFNKIIDKICDANVGFSLLVNNLTITPCRLKKINDRGFYISLIYYFKVWSWFGYQYYYIFEKREDKKNMVEFVFKDKCYMEE